MDNFIIKWASNQEALKVVIGKLLRYVEVNHCSINIVDVETEEILLNIDDVISVDSISDEIHINAVSTSLFLKRVPVGLRFKLVESNSDRLRISGVMKNIKEFKFNVADVTAEEFIRYLIHNEYISNNTKYEPKSIMIRRSDEDPHTWIYREDAIR